MNFFEEQARAKRQTSRLVALFGLAVVGITLAISGVLVMALELGAEETYEAGTLLERRGGAFVAAAIATLAVIGLASLYKMGKLRAGGGVVARELGGTLVGSESTNPAHRRLRNVVEEIAIASGVPVPEIYVLDKESGINAFAAGYTPADAAVAVTRGALEQLDRDELQGVIAHEFSHVLNGDMRLNIKLMGVLFGILVLAVAGREVLRHTRGGGKKGGGIVMIALAVMVVGYIGLFFGRLIKASASRQREFLADASAVQFTRQSVGIAGALKKIGGLPQGSKFEAADAEQASHMLFGDGVGYSSLFATHPPLAERIKRIDPRFDPRELDEMRRQMASAAPGPAQGSADEAEGFAVSRAAAAVGAGGSVAAPASIADRVGHPSPENYAAAGALARGIPERLRVAAHMQDAAPAVVLALALDEAPHVRDEQLTAIATLLGVPVREAAEGLYAAAAALDPLERLPLAALAFPALRRRPRPFLEAFVKALERVIHADDAVDLDEYCLAKLVAVQVVDALDPSRAKVTGRRKLGELAAEAAALLATLARHGHDSPEEARRAYVSGIQGLLAANPPYAPPPDPIAALDAALPELDRLDPAGKELLIEALLRTSGHDGRIAPGEAELLRTVCAALHCPMPPLLASS